MGHQVLFLSIEVKDLTGKTIVHLGVFLSIRGYTVHKRALLEGFVNGLRLCGESSVGRPFVG